MRQINTAALRDAAPDEQVPAFSVTVKRHAGDDVHWRINEDGDLVVSVITHQHEVPIEALVGGVGGLGRGLLFVPDEGTEGIVVFDHGDFEGDCTFIPRASRGAAAAVGLGLGPGKVHVVGLEVVVHDGAGSVEPLVRRSEYNGHTHGPGTFTNSGGDVLGISGGAADVTGTSVLKAK